MAHPCIRVTLPLRERFYHLGYRNSFHISHPTMQLYSNRHASSASSTKPRTLEKPAKFNPPSHPARLNRAPPRQYPGSPLSAPEVEAQKIRQYPHMMPPEGSFMRWFLTNRSIHIWITLSTLFSLAFYTFISNFHRTSPFTHLLPPAKAFPSHPLDWISQYIEVYKLHTARISEETAEKRRKKVEDVQKRGHYRKAHGLDKEQGWGGWTAKSDDELLGPALRTDEAIGNKVPRPSSAVAVAPTASDREEAVYVDWEGRKKPVKKWFGIW